MLLTDEETGMVSNAQTARGLADGADYIDLEHHDQGVQRTNAGTRATMGHVLPKNAVSAVSWGKILAEVNRKRLKKLVHNKGLTVHANCMNSS